MRMRRFRVGLVGLAVAVAAPLWLAASPAAHAEADGCATGLKSDFNGDGRSDTVVADPYATVNGQAQAGRVIVLYGDADGRIGEGARGVIYQGYRGRRSGRRGQRPVRIRPRRRRHRLRRLHRPDRRHSVRGHRRPGRLRLRPDHLGLRGRVGRRRRNSRQITQNDLPQRRHRRRRPVRLRRRRPRGRRTGRHRGSGRVRAGHRRAGRQYRRSQQLGLGRRAARLRRRERRDGDQPELHRRARLGRGGRPFRRCGLDQPVPDLRRQPPDVRDRRGRRRPERGCRHQGGRGVGDRGEGRLLRRVPRQRQPHPGLGRRARRGGGR